MKATTKSPIIQAKKEIIPAIAKTVNRRMIAIATMPIVLFFRRISGDKLLAAGTLINLHSILKLLNFDPDPN